MQMKSILDVPTTALSLLALRGRGSADDYRPIRPNPGFSEERLDFGTLVGVSIRHRVVVLHVDRLRFFTEGETVDRQRGGETDFVLDPRASLQAEKVLRTARDGKPGRQTLSRHELVRNLARLEAEHRGALVWLRHAGSDGPVTALAEQYVPPRYRANPGQH